jgi:hypothetical protein
MKRALIGVAALLALFLGGYVISAVLPHSQPGVSAVAPPSPTPTVQPSPSPVASPSPTDIPSPTPTQAPSPAASPVPSPSLAPSPQPTPTPNSPWTSLGSVDGTSVYRRCDGNVTIYLAITSGSARIATVLGGTSCQ